MNIIRNDIVYINAIKNNNNQEAFTYIFNKYFSILLTDLSFTFKKVRYNVLQDIAIETVEHWYFNKLNDWKSEDVISYLITEGRSRVFSILKPRAVTQDSYSDISDNEHFLDVLTFATWLDYDNDAAKMTFKLKKTIDRHIEFLSERDYNVLMLFLDGYRDIEIVRKIGLNKSRGEVKRAFQHLKEIVFQTSSFENNRKKYIESNVKKHNKEATDMYYLDRISIVNIAKCYNVKSKIATNWIQRCNQRINNKGVLNNQIKPEGHRKKRRASFHSDKEIYLKNKSFNFKYKTLLSEYFELEVPVLELSKKYKIGPTGILGRIKNDLKNKLS